MDHKIKPSKVYTPTPTNISNKENEGFDDTINGQEKWGEGGAITQSMNITTLQDLETPEVDEHEQSNVTRSQVTGVKPQVRGLTKSSCGIETW